MHKLNLIQSNGLVRRLALCAAGASLLGAMATADAAAPAGAPQVLLAITNSESMDGTTAGAIMVGSGSLGSSFSALSSSTSPTNYAIPTGFTPPLNIGSAGSAPYTVTCGSNLCDNGPSRMNMTKAAITNVLASYGSTLNFGLFDYQTSSVKLYTTWVYLMSPTPGGFTFTNTASATTVNNPCYNYTAAASTVKTPCGQIAGQYGTGVLNTYQYMNISDTSDEPLINDVLYAGGQPATFLTYGTVTPANPYTAYTITDYNSGSVSVGYNADSYQGACNPSSRGSCPIWATFPTNAGYVAYSTQVFYSERGFGYGASQSATDGNVEVPMSTDPASSTFTNALLPETNSVGTNEIKSSAGQSAIYALMTGAQKYLKTLSGSLIPCQTQSVVLMTDGLPTLDKSGNAWPPIGTTSGTAFGVTASYDSTGKFVTSTSQAMIDAITSITSLNSKGIKVFVIGLGAGVTPANNPEAKKFLTAMAIAGGTTDFYPATDSISLTAAFASVADFIYRSSALAAPVAPISVAGGTSYEYELTSISTPASGHVQAFSVAASGVASSTSSWDAGDSTHMSTTTRSTKLYSTSTTGSVVALSSVDAAAFNLTSPSGCVPDVATIISYTVDPSYAGPSSGCTPASPNPYLGTRQAGWPLGIFSTQNTGRFMGPPQSALLTARYSGYATWARGLAARKPSVLFTDSDGFLYSVDASSGVMQWGWTSRSILAQLQNYSTFNTFAMTNGNFTVVDAMNGSGAWGSYVVGSLQSGAEHFSLALDSTGTPTTVIYDTVVTGSSSPGDKAGTTGNTPLRQPPVIAYIGNSAIEIYVGAVGTGNSTLYERDVTSTSAASSMSLGFIVTSVISLDANSNQLWLGGSDGSVRFLRLSGVAANDVATMTTIGTVVDPSKSTSTPVPNVLYVGYVEVSGIPYVYAANSAQITVFGIASTGWVPLWASTPSQGYSYSTTTSTWTSTTAVTTMTPSSVVSDLPIQVGPGLLVPTFVASTATCPPAAGNGYYDFFNFADGTFPVTGLTYNSVLVTSDMLVGVGPAFTPSLTAITGGIALSPGSLGNPNPPTSPLKNLGGLGPRAISWTQH